MADDANPRAIIGDNAPPADPFGAVTTHMSDLVMEAKHWADGTKVETQAQADEVSRLIDDLRKAGDVADDLRLAEKKPLDDKIEAIQQRFNLWIGGLKSKVKNPGKIVVAIDALKAALKPYLDAVETERLAAVEKARQEAQAAQQAAADAARAAAPDDLAAREQAEDLIHAAAVLVAGAKRIENTRTHAKGGDRAMGLTKTWTPMLTDPRAALGHYVAERPQEVKDFLLSLAVQDVRAGKRAIVGFDIVEGSRL